MDFPDHTHHTMDGGGMMAPPQPEMNGPDHHHMRHHHMMMHMTFFWGSKAEVLFSGWPGTRPGMYALALLLVFLLAFLVEWLSHCNLIREGSNRVGSGIIRTLMHAVRVGLGYLVMLAVMSFNVGILLVAVGGHGIGFLCFASRVFKRPSGSQTTSYVKTSDLPPMSC